MMKKKNQTRARRRVHQWMNAKISTATALCLSSLGCGRGEDSRRASGHAPVAADVCFEVLEPRLLMSADPAGAVEATQTVEADAPHVVAGQTTSVEVDRSGVVGADRLTLRRSGDHVQLLDRVGRVIMSEPAADLHAIDIIGRAGRQDRLKVNFAIGGLFAVPGGVTYDGGGGNGTDIVSFVGDPAGGRYNVDADGLTDTDFSLLLTDVERFNVFTGAGDDTVGVSGDLPFDRLEVADRGGDDVYDIKTGGGFVKVTDRGGNDTYQLNATGGESRIRDMKRGQDTIDLSNAAGGVNLALRRGVQALGSANVRLNGGFEVVIGSPFGDHLTGNQGNNVLVGGGGEDELNGRGGHDILIGDADADMLRGGTGQDILIGGTTSFDDDPAALAELMADWTDSHRFRDRLEDVRFTGDVDDEVFLANGLTVFENAGENTLDGGRGRDYAPLGENDGELIDIENASAPVVPDFSAATFSDPLNVDNTFFPLIVGSQRVYEVVEQDDEEIEADGIVEEQNEENGDGPVIEGEGFILDVLSDTNNILGIEARIVRDQAFEDGLLVEETFDYYAQDDDDNVWYLGEDVTNFVYDDDGNLIETNNDSAWLAGVNGALPGIVMHGEPVVGDFFYQEFAPLDESLDQGLNAEAGVEAEGPLGGFEDVLRVLESSPVDPGVFGNKYFAPNFGLIFEEDDLDEEGEAEKVIEMTHFSFTEPPTLADFAEAEFSHPTTIDNEYYPLVPGSQRVFQVEAEEGGEGALLVEETFDYYAQDDESNVWYMGEDVTNFVYDDDGNLIETNNESAWLSGVNTAFAGIIMPGEVVVGDFYFQEYAPNDDALGQGSHIDDNGEVEGPVGTFGDVLVVRETNPSEPEAVGLKHYAPGFGLVAEDEGEIVDGQDVFDTRVDLISLIVPLKDTKLNIENNDTDLDTGFQGFIDGEGWQRLEVTNPDDELILSFEAMGDLSDLGLTELFFETVEPENAEVPIADMLAILPQGDYPIAGPFLLDGAAVELTAGTATLTHNIPDGPALLTPGEGANLDAAAEQTFSWDPVTQNIDGGPVDIIAYQLIIENVEQPHDNMIGKLGLSTYVPAATTSITLPANLLETDADYEWEVLAIEASGNQTLSSGEFSTGLGGNSLEPTGDPVDPPNLKAAKLNIEHNATDEDTGFQGFIDSEGWQQLDVMNLDDEVVLSFEGHNDLGDLGLTELFFETVKPANDDVSIAEMLALLPAGDYTIAGTSMQNGESGGPTSGTAVLTHTIPAGPQLLGPQEGATVSTEDLVMSWNPVTETIDAGAVNIIAYQLILEKVQPQHPNMIGKIGMSFYVPATVTSVTVPDGILEPGTEYEWEVLAIEESGNQTLSSSEFETEEDSE